MNNETNKQSLFNKLSPKATFFLGLGVSALVFFIIGFFILLAMVLGGSSNTVSNNYPTPGQPTQFQEETGAPEIVVRPVTDEDWVQGDEDAAVTIIEYSDIECPFCGRFHPTMKRVIEEYAGQVKWVYRHFPLVSIHPNAAKAAEAAECAGAQGGNDVFWSYTDELFANQRALNETTYRTAANTVGINADELMNCVNADTFSAKVQQQFTDAQAAGGRGTPHSIIVTADGQNIPASGALPFEQIAALIEQAL